MSHTRLPRKALAIVLSGATAFSMFTVPVVVTVPAAVAQTTEGKMIPAENVTLSLMSKDGKHNLFKEPKEVGYGKSVSFKTLHDRYKDSTLNIDLKIPDSAKAGDNIVVDFGDIARMKSGSPLGKKVLKIDNTDVVEVNMGIGVYSFMLLPGSEEFRGKTVQDSVALKDISPIYDSKNHGYYSHSSDTLSTTSDATATNPAGSTEKFVESADRSIYVYPHGFAYEKVPVYTLNRTAQLTITYEKKRVYVSGVVSSLEDSGINIFDPNINVGGSKTYSGYSLGLCSVSDIYDYGSEPYDENKTIFKYKPGIGPNKKISYDVRYTVDDPDAIPVVENVHPSITWVRHAVEGKGTLSSSDKNLDYPKKNVKNDSSGTFTYVIDGRDIVLQARNVSIVDEYSFNSSGTYFLSPYQVGKKVTATATTTLLDNVCGWKKDKPIVRTSSLTMQPMNGWADGYRPHTDITFDVRVAGHDADTQDTAQPVPINQPVDFEVTLTNNGEIGEQAVVIDYPDGVTDAKGRHQYVKDFGSSGFPVGSTRTFTLKGLNVPAGMSANTFKAILANQLRQDKGVPLSDNAWTYAHEKDTYVKTVHRDGNTLVIELTDNNSDSPSGKTISTWRIPIDDGVHKIVSYDNHRIKVQTSSSKPGSVDEKVIDLGAVDMIKTGAPTPDHPGGTVVFTSGDKTITFGNADRAIAGVSFPDDKGNVTITFTDGRDPLVVPMHLNNIERISLNPDGTSLDIVHTNGNVNTIRLQGNNSVSVVEKTRGKANTRVLRITDPDGKTHDISAPNTYIEKTSFAGGATTITLNNGKTFTIPGLKDVTRDSRTGELVFTWSDNTKNPVRIPLADGYPDIAVTGSGSGRALTITGAQGKKIVLPFADMFITDAHIGTGAHGKTIEWIVGGDTAHPRITALPNDVKNVRATDAGIVFEWSDGTSTTIPRTRITMEDVSVPGDKNIKLHVVRLHPDGEKPRDLFAFSSADAGRVITEMTPAGHGGMNIVTADGETHTVMAEDSFVSVSRDDKGTIVFTAKNGKKTTIHGDHVAFVPVEDSGDMSQVFTAMIVSPGKDGIAGTKDDESVRVITGDAQVTGVTRMGTHVLLNRAFVAGGKVIRVLPPLTVTLENNVTDIVSDGHGGITVSWANGKTTHVAATDVVIGSDSVTIKDAVGRDMRVGRYDPGMDVESVTTSKKGVTTIRFADGSTRDIRLDKRVAIIRTDGDDLVIQFNDVTRPDTRISMRDGITVTEADGVVTIIDAHGAIYRFPSQDTYVDTLHEIRPGVFDVRLNDGSSAGVVDLSHTGTSIRVEGQDVIVSTPNGDKRASLASMFVDRTGDTQGSTGGSNVIFGFAGTDMQVAVSIADNKLASVTREGDTVVFVTSHGDRFPVTLPEHVTDIVDTPAGFEIHHSDGSVTTVKKVDSTVVVSPDGHTLHLVTPTGEKTEFVIGGVYVTQVSRIGDDLVVTMSDGKTYTVHMPHSVSDISVTGDTLTATVDGKMVHVPVRHTMWQVETGNGNDGTATLIAHVPGVDTPIRFDVTDTFVTGVEIVPGESGSQLLRVTRSDGKTWVVPLMTGSQTITQVKPADGGYEFIFADGSTRIIRGVRAVAVNPDGDAGLVLIDGTGARMTLGAKGDRGDDGRSAFDVWRAQPGNENKTLEDYRAALNNGGDTGLPRAGAPGDPGKDGRDGRLLLRRDTCASNSAASWLLLPAVIGLIATGVHVVETVNLPGFTGVKNYLNSVDPQRVAAPLGYMAALVSATGIAMAALNTSICVSPVDTPSGAATDQ